MFKEFATAAWAAGAVVPAAETSHTLHTSHARYRPTAQRGVADGVTR
jgi:hypothetical protein